MNLQRKSVCACEGGCPHCQPLQAKLKIGEPNDMYEQEADRVAEQVMRMPDPLVQAKQACPDYPFKDKEEDEVVQTKPVGDRITPLVQRQALEEEEPAEKDSSQEEQLQAKAAEGEVFEAGEEQGGGGGQAGPGRSDAASRGSGVQAEIRDLRGGGSTLPESARNYFEPRFGADFGGVRVHADEKAAQTAGALQARAFTVGKDIVFARNQYSPGSVEGEKLLAHELAHVMQQNKDDLSSERQEGKQVKTNKGPADTVMRQTPGTPAAGNLNKVDVVVESTEVGTGLVVPYNHSQGRLEIDYSVPTYKVTVSGSPNAATTINKDFEAVRFGILREGKDPKTPPATWSTVGLADAQTFTPVWDKDYSPHSAQGKQRVGAWQLYKSWFVHEGASDPKTESLGAIGCIEVVGPKKWDEFLETIETIAGVACKDVNAKKPKKLTVNIKKVKNRPVAKFVQDNRGP